MGREIHDQTHAVVHSSIALLQERFRQLQRVKEVREERELLRILSEHNINNNNNLMNNPTMICEPLRLVFHSDHHHHHHHLIFPQIRSSPSAPQVSLSLWPALQCSSSASEDQYYCSSINDQTPLLMMKLWPLDTHAPAEFSEASSDKSHLDSDPDHDYSDVDTSLHL
ncbi:hypothetical protein L484_010582 [Morus notabilis]|uniref:Uncharacterized protein n=1 Tax=Morus notabilis TaxID=981085 RepID=W9QDY3_9ROSA|nr:hypothetical protein L484_010582 [Morus notabilis]